MILAILTGWIPGPGGIPLFLAGVGLLAINHEWARRFLRYLKTTGLNLAEKFFKDHPILMAIYDILAVILVIIGIALLISIHGNIKAMALVCFSIGLALFLGNRQRLQRISNYFKTKA